MFDPSGSDDTDTNRKTDTTEPPSPSGTSGVPEPDPDPVGQLFDVVSYAVATTLVFAGVSALLAVAIGSPPAPGVKYGLFVFGWLAFGYGTVMLWPKAAWKERQDSQVFDVLLETPSKHSDTRFQRLVQRLPPARFRQIPDHERLSTGARVFIAAIVMLATSLVLEQAFGIGP